MTTLAGKKCRPLPAGTPALTRARIDALLAEVPGWAFDGSTHSIGGISENDFICAAKIEALGAD